MFENKLRMPIFFSQINKDFNKLCERFLKPKGFGKLHAFYLICLYDKINGLKLNEINDYIGCDKANTSRAIADLENKNIICRDSPNNCEKKYFVKLTSLGLELCKEFILKIKEEISKMFKRLTDDEFNIFIRLLNKLAYGEEK